MIAVLAEYVDDAVLVILLTLCQATQHTTVNDYWTPLSLVERTEKDSAGFTEAGTVRHRQTKEASILRSHHEATRELPEERDNARNNARCTQARRPCTAWMDNIKTWTGLSVEESIRMTEDRHKWTKYIHGGSRTAKESSVAKEQNFSMQHIPGHFRLEVTVRRQCR